VDGNVKDAPPTGAAPPALPEPPIEVIERPRKPAKPMVSRTATTMKTPLFSESLPARLSC
jgi:hypothetical protein